MYTAFAIILAAGSGRRMDPKGEKEVPKVLYKVVKGQTVIQRSVELIAQGGEFQRVLVVVSEEFWSAFESLSFAVPVTFVAGGLTRQESVYNALTFLRREEMSPDGIVLIHDGARCNVCPVQVAQVLKQGALTDAATLAYRVPDTLVKEESGTIDHFIPRDNTFIVQTPQVFKFDLIYEAHSVSEGTNNSTDDTSLVHRSHPVALVEGSPLNFKLTTPLDFQLLQALILQKE